MNRVITLDEFNQILNYLRDDIEPENLSPTALYPYSLNTWKRQWDEAVWQDNGNFEIYYNDRQVIPYEDINQLLVKLWVNPYYGGTGIARFYERINTMYYGITKSVVTQFLNSLEAYQLHKRVARSRTVNPIVPRGPGYYQIDLIDMSKYSRQNRGKKWILTTMDLFTKHVWVAALRNKKGRTIATALRFGIENGRINPRVIQSDRGGEFNNGPVSALLKEHGIKHQLSLSHKPESQASIERFNGTLKRELNVYFTALGSHNWIDIILGLVTNYNNSVHSTTKVPPSRANDHREVVSQRLRHRAIQSLEQSPNYPSLEVGDTVRLALQSRAEYRKNIFRKKYLSQWSEQLWTVVYVIQPTALSSAKYGIENEDGFRPRRRYYRFQLQKVDPNQMITVQATKKIYEKSIFRPTNPPTPPASPVHIPSPPPPSPPASPVNPPTPPPINTRPKRNPRPGNNYDLANYYY